MEHHRHQSSMVDAWVLDIHRRLADDVTSLAAREDAVWKQKSIYKIPPGFGVPSRRHAYQPQIVSFGPYHHGDSKLKGMEEHKNRALLHFLVRSQVPLPAYLRALEDVAEKLMWSYEELEEEWRDRERFLQLMIVDGCFMIEVLRTASWQMPEDYAASDPIFSRHGVLNTIPRMKRDMLMLENQIPLLVLKTLIAVEIRSPDLDEFVNRLVRNFFSPQSPIQKELGLHVLDVVRKSLLEEPPRTKWKAGRKAWSSDVIWPATKLKEAGIDFKKSSSSSSLKDISFERGVLSLPEIILDESSESTFLNLMAFEHLHTGAGNEVSSYVSFMDNIIDSERDVILLSESNIVKNFVGTDSAVAKLFDGIAQGVSIDPVSRLSDVHQAVTEYCSTHWWRNLVCIQLISLKRAYFQNLWTIMSLAAAILLLSLTILQSVYTILQYYKPN